MTHETDFVEHFVAAFPALGPVLSEHLSDQEGELLPYLFFGDVAEWLTTDADTVGPTIIEPMLAWLEQSYETGTFDIRNLIDVGIIEMLPATPTGDPILQKLGPRLRERAAVAGLL